MGPDGGASYNLPLNGYASGVYSIVVKRATDQYEAVFTVGLQTGSGPIQVRTTKDTYAPGETILILGSSAKNILLTITLIDPDGDIVKRKESFTDKNGIFTEGSFKVPLSVMEGTWSITTTSGTNSAKVDLKILKQLAEGLVVELDKESYRSGDVLTANGFGAKGGKVFFDILDFNNSTIIDKFESPITDNGNFQGLWKVPAEIEPGAYILKAKDSFKTIEITLNIVK